MLPTIVVLFYSAYHLTSGFYKIIRVDSIKSQPNEDDDGHDDDVLHALLNKTARSVMTITQQQKLCKLEIGNKIKHRIKTAVMLFIF